MWRTQIITKMAETYILKRLLNGLFQQLSLLCLFGCLPNEMSEGSLSFHLFIGDPQLRDRTATFYFGNRLRLFNCQVLSAVDM